MDDEDLSNFVVEDEAEKELHSVLHRSRLIKQVEGKSTEPKRLAAEQVSCCKIIYTYLLKKN